MAIQTEQYQNTDYLVEADWLEQHLNNTNLRAYDCHISVQVNSESGNDKSLLMEMDLEVARQ